MSELTREINGKVGGLLRIPAGTYTIDEPVNVRSAVLVEAGANITASSRITMADGSAWMTEGGKHNLAKSGSDHFFIICGSDVNIGGFNTDESLSSAGFTFLIDTSASREHIRIGKVRTVRSRGLIADNSLPGGIIVDLRIEDVMARQHCGRASLLTRAFAYIGLKQCTADYVGTPDLAAANVPAWCFINNEGLELDYVDVTGNAAQGACSNQYGFYFQNVRAATIKQAMADGVGGPGFYFGGCNWIDAPVLKSSMNGGQALIVAGGTSNLRMGKVFMSGRAGVAFDTKKPLMFSDGTGTNVYGEDLQYQAAAALYDGAAQSKIQFGRIVAA